MGGKRPRHDGCVSRRPLCLSTRLWQRDGGKRPRHGGLRYRGDRYAFRRGFGGAMRGTLAMTAALLRQPVGALQLRRRDGGKRPRMTAALLRRLWGFQCGFGGAIGGTLAMTAAFRGDHPRLTAPLRPDGCRIPARRARGCSRARSSRRRGSADRGAFRGAPERRAACRARGR